MSTREQIKQWMQENGGFVCARCGAGLEDGDYDWVDQEPWCRGCLDERGPDEEAIEGMLIELIRTAECEDATYGDVDLSGASVNTFEQACLLTRDRGVVLRLAGGQEFQIAIVQSKGAF